jgi:hypothetical protein
VLAGPPRPSCHARPRAAAYRHAADASVVGAELLDRMRAKRRRLRL